MVIYPADRSGEFSACKALFVTCDAPPWAAQPEIHSPSVLHKCGEMDDAASFTWSLEGMGAARLQKLELGMLRSMCEARELAISGGAHRKTCVEKLLEWKQHPTAPTKATAAGAKAAAPATALSDIPWDLKSYAEARLLKRDLDELRDLCSARCIKPGATAAACVKSLLEWKEQLNTGVDGPGGDAPPPPPPPPSAALRPPPRSVVATFQQHDYGDWRGRINELVRDDVHGHCDALRAKQRGNGAYTLRPLMGVAHSSDAPEVDHVFECQAMGDVLFRVEALRPALAQVDWETFKKHCSHDKHFKSQPMAVQNALAHARDVHNRSEHLVVCGSLVNKKKQGAFQSSLNRLAKGQPLEQPLEDSIRINCGKGVEPFEPDDAARIARTVVGYLRDLEDPLTAAMRDVPLGAAQGGDQQARYDGVADEIVQLYENFDITRRV